MPELLILRHAEAIDKEAGFTDFDRVLTKKGQGQADRMGRLIAHRGLQPDLVVSSPAPRALQTAERACAAIGVPADRLRQDETIYEAGVPSLLDVVRRHGGKATRLMIVGHNPSLEGLANLLLGKGGLELGKGDCLVLAGTASWDRLGQEPMRLTAHLEP